jgi:hypothetical protein
MLITCLLCCFFVSEELHVKEMRLRERTNDTAGWNPDEKRLIESLLLIFKPTHSWDPDGAFSSRGKASVHAHAAKPVCFADACVQEVMAAANQFLATGAQPTTVGMLQALKTVAFVSEKLRAISKRLDALDVEHSQALKAAAAAKAQEDEAAAAVEAAAEPELQSPASGEANKQPVQQELKEQEEEKLGALEDHSLVSTDFGENKEEDAPVEPKKKPRRSHQKNQERRQLSAEHAHRAKIASAAAEKRFKFALCSVLEQADVQEHLRVLANEIKHDEPLADLIFFDPPDPSDKNLFSVDDLERAAEICIDLLAPHGMLVCYCTSEQYAILHSYVRKEHAHECFMEPSALIVIPHPNQLPKGNQYTKTQMEATSVHTHTLELLVQFCLILMLCTVSLFVRSCVDRISVLILRKSIAQCNNPCAKKELQLELVRPLMHLVNNSKFPPNCNVIDGYKSPHSVTVPGSHGHSKDPDPGHLAVFRMIAHSFDKQELKKHFGDCAQVLQWNEDGTIHLKKSAAQASSKLKELEDIEENALDETKKRFKAASQSKSTQSAARAIAVRNTERDSALAQAIFARFFAMDPEKDSKKTLLVLDACSGTGSVARGMLALKAFGIDLGCVSIDNDPLVVSYARKHFSRDALEYYQSEVSGNSLDAKRMQSHTAQLETNPAFICSGAKVSVALHCCLLLHLE